MQEIHIITPITRATHIPLIYQSIEKSARKVLNSITWWPLFLGDALRESAEWNERFSRGNVENLHVISLRINESEQPYEAINRVFVVLEDSEAPVMEDWVYVLTDDNILHEDLIPFLVDKEFLLRPYNGLYFSRHNTQMHKDCCFKIKAIDGYRLRPSDTIHHGIVHKLPWQECNLSMNKEGVHTFYNVFQQLSYANYFAK